MVVLGAIAADGPLRQFYYEQSSLKFENYANNGHAQEEIVMRTSLGEFLLDLICLIDSLLHRCGSDDEKLR